MNIVIHAMARIFSFGERWNIQHSNQLCFTSLIETFHRSPRKNILTIALKTFIICLLSQEWCAIVLYKYHTNVNLICDSLISIFKYKSNRNGQQIACQNMAFSYFPVSSCKAGAVPAFLASSNSFSFFQSVRVIFCCAVAAESAILFP